MSRTRKKEPSPRVLRRLIDYCPKTGELTWKARPLWMAKKPSHAKRFNTVFAGKLALSYVDSDGYAVGNLFNRRTPAHRVAYAIYYGEWPTSQIDHLNGDRSYNRIANLRAASHSDNMQNRKIPKHNKSGHIGVKQRANGNWRAQVMSKVRAIFDKTFGTYEEACAAQEAAAVKAGFHPNHGRAA